jgi:hypothetical protein
VTASSGPTSNLAVGSKKSFENNECAGPLAGGTVNERARRNDAWAEHFAERDVQLPLQQLHTWYQQAPEQ